MPQQIPFASFQIVDIQASTDKVITHNEGGLVELVTIRKSDNTLLGAFQWAWDTLDPNNKIVIKGVNVEYLGARVFYMGFKPIQLVTQIDTIAR